MAFSLLDLEDQIQQPTSLLPLPDDRPAALQPDPRAEALGGLYQQVMDRIAEEQRKSTEMGLWDDQTGMPTRAGLLGALHEAASGVAMGTTSAGGFTPMGGLGRALAAGEEKRISTAIPTAVAKRGAPPPPDPHQSADFNINLDTAKAAPEAFANNALTLRGENYPDLPLRGMRNPDNIVDRAVDHMADNLVWLHGQMHGQFGPGMVGRSSRWYDGANQIATDLGSQTGLGDSSVAGAMAALSPQKNWFENVDLTKRLIDMKQNPGRVMTPEMNDWASNYLEGQVAKADTPKKQAAAAELQMSIAALRRGTPYGEINDPDTRALFARAWDEAHNPRDVPVVNPEGDLNGQMMTNDDGSPRKIAWGSFGEIRKALAALDSGGDLPTISRLMGGNHKVRSFHNNIISPDAPQGDVTIDTHAIAAAHLRPLGSGDPVVGMGLGLEGSSNNATGSRGGYGIYHEAYRRAAERLGLLPRQMQSIAWEGVRGLFSPEQKRNGSFVDQNANIWQGFRNGQYTADEARAQILNHARGDEGLAAPDWWQPGLERP